MKYATAVFLSIACILIGNTLPIYCQATQEKDSLPELKGMLPAQPAAAPSDLSSSVTISIEQDYIPVDHMRGLVVKVTNQSQHPVLVDGDGAKAILPLRNAATLIDLEKVERPPTGFTEVLLADTRDTLIAGFTVGAVPAIEGIEIQHKPILERYGRDERRRQNEVQRFGKRIMWPAEISSGIIYFKTDESLEGSRLEVPLSLPFRGAGASQVLQTISAQVTK